MVTVDREGQLIVEDKDAKMRLRSLVGNFRLVTDAPGLIVLRRELPDEPEDSDEDEFETSLALESGELELGGRVILAGEILTRMTLFQMIEVIAERGFAGDLSVFGAEVTLQLAFDQGALKHAKSDSAEDRLGELLVREGYLSSQKLTELLWEVTPTRRFGQVCLERQIIGQDKLFECLRRQTEDIFYRTLLVDHGSYVLTTPDPRRDPPALTVHVPVRPLLMQGIQRLDEMELYRQVIPSDDVCLDPKIIADERSLDASTIAVLSMCDGETTLAVIARETGLSDYDVTRAAYHLVRSNIASIKERSRIDESEVRELVAAFSAVMSDIFAAISMHGATASASEMLSAWVMGCGYDSVFGATVAESGEIDEPTALAWVRAAREDNPVSSFHQVAHELVSFAMFCAGSTLPREEELKLSRDVNRRLQSIRVK